MFRIAPDLLDEKVECSECHRVFFPKTTAGKRVKPPDHTRIYVGFGIGAVAIIGLFFAISGGGAPEKTTKPPAAPATTTWSLGTHPRAQQLVNWAQAVGSGNDLVLRSHSDFAALAALLGAAGGDDAVIQALRSHDATRYLRELDCGSGALASAADMDAPSGKGVLFVTPKPGDDNYKRNTRGEYDVSFRMAGDQVKVTGITLRLKPVWNPDKPDPSRITFQPHKEISRPAVVEITDSAGSRKVAESQPAPVPHWDQATPAQRQMADEVVADVLRSAEPDIENPGRLFNRATLRIRDDADRKAAVPRILNAMYELYGDVNQNNLKLSQLNRALVAVTGYAVNYQVENGSDPAKDKAARESCVRQWFAFWYRYHGNLSEFFDQRENLDDSRDAPTRTGK